jgi:hypothetical protein
MSRNNGLEKSTSYKTYKPREGPVRPTIHGHLTDLYPWYQCMAAPEIFSIAAQSSEAKPGELEAGYHELLSENGILDGPPVLDCPAVWNK